MAQLQPTDQPGDEASAGQSHRRPPRKEEIRLFSDALPHDLASDSSYPLARWERLPPTKVIEKADPGEDARIFSTDYPEETVHREHYLLNEELIEAVDLAMALGRPLLLQGDPGCGKTRLAHAAGYALGVPVEECYIKSTSRAQDLLYRFDGVRRLYAAQVAKTVPGIADEETLKPSRYVRLGPLGRAIGRATKGRGSVVLIDEIDKADLDFPNDLLRELERMEFSVDEVPEMTYRVAPDERIKRPLVIVTHNDERPLPAAFLRRCVYYYVPFPEKDLTSILRIHGIHDANLTSRAIEILLKLRELKLTYKPGLSELIEWAGYAQAVEAKPQDLPDLGLGVLLKRQEDRQRASEVLKSFKSEERETEIGRGIKKRIDKGGSA